MRNYIYVDNSNVFIEGQRVSAVKRGHARSIVEAMNRRILDFDWNVDYGRLYEIICGDVNQVGAARLWGSPPPGDSLWQMVKRNGWDVEIFQRSFAGKEKKVDVAIATRMMQDAFTIMPPGGAEITLVAGDRDFVPVVAALVAEGFPVCVAFWSHASRELRETATSFFSLDPYVDIVGRRRTRPAA